jgi:hypothetical protein
MRPLTINIPQFLRDYARPIENSVVVHAEYNGCFEPDEDPADYIKIHRKAMFIV